MAVSGAEGGVNAAVYCAVFLRTLAFDMYPKTLYAPDASAPILQLVPVRFVELVVAPTLVPLTQILNVNDPFNKPPDWFAMNGMLFE